MLVGMEDGVHGIKGAQSLPGFATSCPDKLFYPTNGLIALD